MGENYFFGWGNIKHGITELIKVFSNKPSLFSIKRINTEIAFLSAIGVDLMFVFVHRNTIQSSEVLAHVALLFAAAGYHLNEVAKEKRFDKLNNQPSNSDQNGVDKNT